MCKDALCNIHDVHGNLLFFTVCFPSEQATPASFAVLPSQDTTPTTVQETVTSIWRRDKKVTCDRQRNRNVPLTDGRTVEVDHLFLRRSFCHCLVFQKNASLFANGRHTECLEAHWFRMYVQRVHRRSLMRT